MDKEKWIKCSCWGEAMQLSVDDDNQIEICIWSTGLYNDHGLSWKEKIRWIWHLLKTGKPYTDMIMLSPESAKELNNWLSQYIKATNTGNKK